MILIHRLTPFAIGIVTTAGLALTSLYPLTALWALPLMLAIDFFLITRLSDYRFKDKDFWGLIATPISFILAATLLFVLADDGSVRMMIAIMTGFLSYFYHEHLFRFTHLPAAYQAYGLQNTSGVMSILTVFYLMAGAYASLSFIRLPLAALSVFLFIAVFGVTLSAFWMSKVPHDRARLYALGSAVVFTEIFVAGSYLSTPYMTNGALIAVLYYMYVGLARAHVLAKLSRLVIRRYVGIGVIMFVALILTARWI